MLSGEQPPRRLLYFTMILAGLCAALLVGGSPTAAQDFFAKDQKGGLFSRVGWRDDFEDPQLDESRWTIEDWQSPAWKFPAPGYLPGNHLGLYEAEHVKLVRGSGRQYLRLLLTQENGPVDENPLGVISRGALLYSKKTFGYGTFEWRMRMSSTGTDPEDPLAGAPVSGSVSAGFIYVNNSETEIDAEFSSHTVHTFFPETLYAANWNNPNPSTGPTDLDFTFTVAPVVGINREFHTYAFEWKPDGITFFVDGVAQVIHRTNLPSAPAHFMINHWGTNRPEGFGGPATVGVARYLYVDWVRFTPLP